VPTIASPVYTYATSITDKETGFLCSPGEWTDAILKLSEDAKLRKQIATNAKKYCLEHYSPKACRKITEEVFGHILKDLA
jgi:glycosyltransferase involved in cell wall biosynthesis